MRRSTLLELSGMELHEVAHVRRCFAGELAQGVRHAVVTPLSGQLGHGRQKWMRVRVQGGFELAQGSATRLKAPLSQISWPVSTLSEIARGVRFSAPLRLQSHVRTIQRANRWGNYPAGFSPVRGGRVPAGTDRERSRL